MMFKETPIVFDFMHLICLFLGIVTISGIAILIEASFCLSIHADSDIIAVNMPSVLSENDQYDKPTIVWDLHSLLLGIQLMFILSQI